MLAADTQLIGRADTDYGERDLWADLHLIRGTQATELCVPLYDLQALQRAHGINWVAEFDRRYRED